uniref:Uncharacterized protein n=1 Tax=Ciona savignyi TaxID=51511 RepID=H2Z8E9_CIOSA
MGKAIFILLVLMCGIADLFASSNECYVKQNIYKEGEHFQHTSKSGCVYNCTCEISNGRPIGNCTHRCNVFTYPPGCYPTHNACGCATDYNCSDGEKCQDKETGLLHSVGDSWRNSTCTCTCLGQARGVYQCECRRPTVRPAKLLRGNTCVPNSQDTCYSCPVVTDTGVLRGNPLCSERRKCDQWPYIHSHNGRNLTMTCTCYGPNGLTQCVPARRQSRIKRSILFSIITVETSESRHVSAGEPMIMRVK